MKTGKPIPERVFNAQKGGYVTGADSIIDDGLQMSQAEINASYPNRSFNNNGMGYVILRTDKTFAQQVTEDNTIYEIRYEFNLQNTAVALPENAELHFVGGSIKNGTLTGDFTSVVASPVRIFNNVTIGGTWNVSMAFAEWFGAPAQGNTNYNPSNDNPTTDPVTGEIICLEIEDTPYIQRCINAFGRVDLINNYLISTVKVGQHKIVEAKNQIYVRKGGKGIWLNDKRSSYRGGFIYVYPDATAITIGSLASGSDNIRRVVVENTRISHIDGQADTIDTYGIKLVANSGKYNTFLEIRNVNIYHLPHGLSGNVRSSLIDVTVEQCAENIRIEGDLNNIRVVGQACPIRFDFEYFMYIYGGSNVLLATIYDVGSEDKTTHEPYQRYSLYETGYNYVEGISGHRAAASTEMRWNRYKDYDFGCFNVVPNYTYELENCTRETPLPINLFQPQYTTAGYIALTPTSNDGVYDEAVLTLNIGTVYDFIEFASYCLSANYAFSRIELYSGDTLLETSLLGRAFRNNIAIHGQVSAAGYFEVIQNLKIKLYFNKQVRLRRFALYAASVPHPLTHGSASDIPTFPNVSNGQQYLIEDAKVMKYKNVPVTYMDGSWYMPNGNAWTGTIDDISQASFRKTVSAAGEYKLLYLETNKQTSPKFSSFLIYVATANTNAGSNQWGVFCVSLLGIGGQPEDDREHFKAIEISKIAGDITGDFKLYYGYANGAVKVIFACTTTKTSGTIVYNLISSASTNYAIIKDAAQDESLDSFPYSKVISCIPTQVNMQYLNGLSQTVKEQLEVGLVVYNTGNNRKILWNGTDWVDMDGTSLQKSGASSDRPSSPIVGQTYFDTSLSPKKMIVYNGTDWVNLDGTALT